MKVRSNPKHSSAAVQWPFLRGVFVGAEAVISISRDAGGRELSRSISYKFSDEDVDLLTACKTAHEYQCKHPQEFAYFVRKCQTGELLAADEEMAKLAGVKLAPPAPRAVDGEDEHSPVDAVA